MPGLFTRPTISHVLGDDARSLERSAAQLARSLQDQFRFVFIFVNEAGSIGDGLRNEGFPVETLKRSQTSVWRCARQLSECLNRYHVDVIHAHQYPAFFQSLLSRPGSHRCPIVYTEDGSLFRDTPRWWRPTFNRLMSRSCDRIVALGNDVRRQLVEREGLPSGRIEVVYHGVDIHTYAMSRKNPALRNRIRRQLGLARDDYAVLQVAALEKELDPATAIHSVARLRQTGIASRLLLVGDGPERSALQELVCGLPYDDVVQFLGERSDLPQLLSAADAFLLTGATATVSEALMAAMSAGVPCIAARVGSVPEVLTDGECALLAEPEDDVHLAMLLQQLHHDAELKREIVTAAAHRAAEMFCLQRTHDAYATLYHSLSRTTDAAGTTRSVHTLPAGA